ncbi:MAG: protein phosphatase 2C domain-containing protein [Hyphomicrobium sp.]|nr:protein phosphatase 2C domain-containing protein [Hyphomicrobium sp.]
MPISILGRESWPSGAANEDRAGARGAYAWVIDGATDVVEDRLTPGPTDAAWFAEALDRAMAARALSYDGDMALLPATLSYTLDSAFRAVALREPAGVEEHPSAAFLALRLVGERAEYVSVGDCALIALSAGHVHLVGVEHDGAGDKWVADEIRAHRARLPDVEPAEARRALWSKLRAARRRMNAPDGYGVVSITPPPKAFVKTGRFAIGDETIVLIASDGLMRIVDVFRRYDPHALLRAAAERGLSELLAELRAIEDADPDGVEFPRAKTSDDATGLLVRLTAG